MSQRTFRMGGSLIRAETSVSLFCNKLPTEPCAFSFHSKTFLLPSGRAEPSGNQTTSLPLQGCGFPGCEAKPGSLRRGGPFSWSALTHTHPGFGPTGAQVSECGQLSWDVRFLDE